MVISLADSLFFDGYAFRIAFDHDYDVEPILAEDFFQNLADLVARKLVLANFNVARESLVRGVSQRKMMYVLGGSQEPGAVAPINIIMVEDRLGL
ncbi:MAG: hypothetical protein JST22_20895 [Bacteroidetes bacterium]|nr:hypothetical protein [Bacteroidota bacterium]